MEEALGKMHHLCRRKIIPVIDWWGLERPGVTDSMQKPRSPLDDEPIPEMFVVSLPLVHQVLYPVLRPPNTTRLFVSPRTK